VKLPRDQLGKRVLHGATVAKPAPEGNEVARESSREIEAAAILSHALRPP